MFVLAGATPDRGRPLDERCVSFSAMNPDLAVTEAEICSAQFSDRYDENVFDTEFRSQDMPEAKDDDA